jgi:hypothetical protein
MTLQSFTHFGLKYTFKKIFGEKNPYLLNILKVWDSFINHITTNLKGLISNIKIDRALE